MVTMSEAMTATILALGATCAGVGQHDESGQREDKEDMVKTTAAMLSCRGADGKQCNKREGGGVM